MTSVSVAVSLAYSATCSACAGDVDRTSDLEHLTCVRPAMVRSSDASTGETNAITAAGSAPMSTG